MLPEQPPNNSLTKYIQYDNIKTNLYLRCLAMAAITFKFPVHSVILSDSAGEKTDKGLKINCILNADTSRNITVNGTPCEIGGNMHIAPVYLNDFKNVITATDVDTGYTTHITVYYLKNAHKKYRFSLDDNIWCFQNIAKNQDVYKSIFEDPYLKLLKTMHDKYGTKFHLNI